MTEKVPLVVGVYVHEGLLRWVGCRAESSKVRLECRAGSQSLLRKRVRINTPEVRRHDDGEVPWVSLVCFGGGQRSGRLSREDDVWQFSGRRQGRDGWFEAGRGTRGGWLGSGFSDIGVTVRSTGAQGQQDDKYCECESMVRAHCA